ncbi:MAG: methionine--tRNA ligase [Sphingomonadales bacterium]|jgi:methionyl-tRNA synthetase
MTQKFYITTAISYPNGVPHIGHAYEAIATDAIARFHRMDGKNVYFVTGTDEHGLKMEQTARKAGKTPREMADQNSARFQEMVKVLGLSNDDFIRTTEERHCKASQAIWKRMEEAGDIYLSKYSGWYSVRDEAYYDESELVEGEGGEKLSPQGTPVEWTEEETYFFRLSAYQDKLLALYEKHPEFIGPETRRNEVASFVKSGLRDLSISRTSFNWGVPVPGDEKHVMYVWVDALTNYITALGYPDEEADLYKKYWPANLHVIGKDIVRFHTVYWPAFLMSAGLPLPDRVFAHGFLFNRGEKMSKSVGNVVDPFDLVDAYGLDQVRYFFLREVPFGQDGSYSHEAIVTRVNAELVNGFGNLSQRVLAFIFKNLKGKLPDDSQANDEADGELLEASASYLDTYRASMEKQQISKCLESWMGLVNAANKYIDEQAPWALRKTDPERMEAVLSVLVRVIRNLAIGLRPFCFSAADKVLDQLGIAQDEAVRQFAVLSDDNWYMPGHVIDKPTPVLTRLELPAEGDD